MGNYRKAPIILNSILLIALFFISGCEKKVNFLPIGTGLSAAVDKPIALKKPDISDKGSMRVPIANLREDSKTDLLISSGIPFRQGKLLSEKDIAFFDNQGNEIPIATKVLARWIQDGSIRSILVQFNMNIPHKYEYLTMKWGEPRTKKDLNIVEVTWEMPDGIVSLPASWLCESKIIGDQVPMQIDRYTGNPLIKYDENILKNFPKLKDIQLSEDTREDNYYDNIHVFYQLYVRTGDNEFFKAARRDAVYYRDKEIIQDGPEKGKNIKYEQTRYVYVQAMADDYLLTGDDKSLKVAGYMTDYLKDTFPPAKAFVPINHFRFWTEREAAFPFLGVITYYELTGKTEYFELAKQYMENLYKTQILRPDRGGFIHNLYFCAKSVGAKIDDYGGCPFMTGLLLEPIVEYHQITGSETAKDSIFRALDWLVKEGLGPDGETFIYLTIDGYRNEGMQDLNMLVAHAFGYGYKISGYKRTDYLVLGKRLFERGVNSAYLETRKHFDQNYRSSGHFLAYISGEDK